MTDWREEIASALGTFRAVDKMDVEFLPARHHPSKLPDGKMAVFGFYLGDECLLISYCGPNSNARYLSQHYNPRSAQSTLAKKLVEDSSMNSLPGFDRNEPGDWIKSNTNRFNILVSADQDRDFTVQLKEHLVEHLQPRYAR